MLNLSQVFRFIALFAILLTGPLASASGVEWSGNYRFEFVNIGNSELDSEKSSKEYMLHHLVLRPRIVASDGLNIYSRFNIFNSSVTDQVGQTLGGDTMGETTFEDSAVTTDRQNPETILVNELYLTLNNEFGQLIVGRVPIHFGLGIAYNKGDGAFDHYFDNRDMVAYKMVFGNIRVTPSLAKTVEGRLNSGAEDASEYNLQVDYTNPGNQLAMGLFYQMRRVNKAAINTNINNLIGGASSTISEDASFNQLGVYVDRDRENYRIGFEAQFRDGKSGIKTALGDSVEYKGTGLALEFEHRPQGKSFVWGIKAGQATGDDSGSDKSYDGFIFDRNYDIAMMLFNHQLGNADFLQTGFIGGGGQGGANGNTGYDVEAISNATYIAPYFNYQWKPKWLVTAKFVTGTLNQEFNDGDTDLGFEVDLGLNYKSDDNFVWVNEVGFFTPGKAFEGGSSNFDTDSALGFVSKIAITF
ncbi:MAG: hypothetical protein CL677_08955 [Bdellovibrionaceae bacterium]|nr:hypothetical protein [Pseudobdellovibrionaceae bacterium]|tara:strand:- start:51879 stop:53291 length:1413 start_codon:yes stop_codon:yes gene_type:complete